MFDLEKQDEFKLNILLKTAKAIRIDNYKLEVIGLTHDDNERIIKLNSLFDEKNYIKQVQKFLIEKVLGLAGSYPEYLKQWSKIGNNSFNLDKLLKIGNINAVLAVANAKNLDQDLLPLVWWSSINTENQAEVGRCLLRRKEFLDSAVAKEIALYLLEFLPFSSDIQDSLNTANLILQNDLISQDNKQKLWHLGNRKHYLLVGFLERQKGNLPNINLSFKVYDSKDLVVVSGEQNQIFIYTCLKILKKINEKYTLYRTLEAIHLHFQHPDILRSYTIEDINLQLDKIGNTDNKIRARMFLAGVSESLVVSEISAHSLKGSTIRKKLGFILEPINQALTDLLN